jgi:hypothetical protein
LPPGVLVEFFVEDAFADVDTIVTNVNAWTGNELAHLRMALSAKRAHGEVRCASHI